MPDQSEHARRGKIERGSTPAKTTRNVDELATKTTSTKTTPKKVAFDPLANLTPQKSKGPPIPKRSTAIRGNNLDMDPFEVRVRFTQFLGNLNASVTSAQKTAQYAIKFRDMDEDLHNCIVEQLERVCMVSTNLRASLMDFRMAIQ